MRTSPAAAEAAAIYVYSDHAAKNKHGRETRANRRVLAPRVMCSPAQIRGRMGARGASVLHRATLPNVEQLHPTRFTLYSLCATVVNVRAIPVRSRIVLLDLDHI